MIDPAGPARHFSELDPSQRARSIEVCWGHRFALVVNLYNFVCTRWQLIFPNGFARTTARSRRLLETPEGKKAAREAGGSGV